MFKNLFILFLSIHIVGDFYLQTEFLATKKISAYSMVLLHCFIYLLGAVAVSLVFSGRIIMYASLLMSFLHFAIDTVKFFLTVKRKSKSEGQIFIVDQTFHLLSIGVVSIILVNYPIAMRPTILGLLRVINSDPYQPLRWLSMIALVAKPANTFIKKALIVFKPHEEDHTIQGAGGWIGTLERTLMLIFLSMGEFGAIGWVLTAKSIARYSKINEEKHFAEYYLCGTLLSMVYVIGVFWLSFS